MAYPSIFSSSCEHDVQAAITRACHEALSVAVDESRFLAPYMTIQDVADEVLALIKQSTAAFASTENDRSSILRMLPAEILCDIFMRLPLSDCIRATHVCKKLRDILLNGNGMLWSRELSFSSPPGMLSALLERSESSSVQLTGRISPDNWAETARCLEGHLDRCTLLHIDLFQLLPAEAQLALTRALCCSSAPQIHTFRLSDSHCQFNAALDAGNLLFAGRAPNLTLVNIFADVRSLSPAAPFHSVKWLLFSSARPPTSMREISTIYARFPGLEAMSMDLFTWIDDHDAPPRMPRDSALTIILPSPPWVSDTQVAAVISRLEGGNTASNVHFAVSYNLPMSQRVDAVTAVTRWDPPTGSAITRLVMNSPLMTSNLSASVFLERVALPGAAPLAHLTVLSIPESVLAMDIPWPPTPALEKLMILVGFPIGDLADEMASCSAFLLPRSRPRLMCPALRELHLVSPLSEHPLFRMTAVHLDPALVAEFIEEHLQFGSGHRPGLVLHTVRPLIITAA